MEKTMKIIPTVREARRKGRLETCAWQTAAVGLFVLSIATNLALSGLYMVQRNQWETDADQLRTRLYHAEEVRDQAVRELGALSLSTARERQARADQAAAYESIGAWEYAGEFTITAYCPCEKCCGRWADGVTASGLPAGPGIVSVDPEVIPLGSTVIIDGQRYLAADTGVTGNHIDIYLTDHATATAFGVQCGEVWVEHG